MGWTEYYNSEDDGEVCHTLDYHRNLNFSLTNEDDDYAFSKRKTARDPMSHRIIEKRRRDRMNNCLADLSRLLPATYMKKGRGRIEKTEIIEMAIKHMTHLQAHACKEMDACEIVARLEKGNAKSDQYKTGYLECMSEVMQFLERERFHPKHPLCIRLLSHLQKHCDNIMHADGSNHNRDTKSSFSSSEDQSKWNRNESISSEEMAPASTVINPKRKLISQTSEENSQHHTVHSKGNDGNNCIKEERSPVQSVHHSGPSNDSNSLPAGSSSGQESDEATPPSRMHNSMSPLSDNQEGTSSLDQDNLVSQNGRSNSSQLREMLLANTGNSRTQSCSSSNSSSRHTDDSNGMYKFKTNIQQRFTADLEHVYPPTSTNSTAQLLSNSMEHGDISDQGTKRRKMFHDERIRRTFSVTACENGERLTLLDSIASVRPSDDEITIREVPRSDSPAERPLSLPPTSPPNHHTPNVINHTYDAGKNEIPAKNGSQSQQNLEHEFLPVSSAKRECNISDHLAHKVESNQRVQQRNWENRSTSSAITAENIPIFALHPKGSFYVPMSVESQMIGSLFSPAMESPLSQPVLHPITINVNFCHPHKTLTCRPVDTEYTAARSAPSSHHQARNSRNAINSPSFPDCRKHSETSYAPTLPLMDLEKQWHQDVDIESHSTNHTNEDHCSRHGNGNVPYVRNEEHAKNSRFSKDHDIFDTQENRRHGLRREGSDSVPNSNRNRDCFTSANSSRWSYLMAVNKRTHPP